MSNLAMYLNNFSCSNLFIHNLHFIDIFIIENNFDASFGKFFKNKCFDLDQICVKFIFP